MGAIAEGLLLGVLAPAQPDLLFFLQGEFHRGKTCIFVG
jgi:hypothetical protein